MDDLHLPNQPFENPMYILPDFIMKEELLDVKVHPLQTMKLENPEEIVPIVCEKQELLNVEAPHHPLKLESPTEIIPIIAVKEDSLDIKDEPGIVHNLVAYAEDRDECNTENGNINLTAGADENPMALCEEETLGDNTGTVCHKSPDSGMQLSLSVNSSSLSDCKIPSVHRVSRVSVNTRMCKKTKISSFQSTEVQTKLVHTGSKPYTCDTCHKCFHNSSLLKTHTRVHTGSKPYNCDYCPKCFSQLGNLQKHIRIHIGRKPYNCDTCHKCFSDPSSLKRHIKIHWK